VACLLALVGAAAGAQTPKVHESHEAPVPRLRLERFAAVERTLLFTGMSADR